jgi:hypothetical protein
MWKIQYKPIENCHMKNVIFKKNFNLGMDMSPNDDILHFAH